MQNKFTGLTECECVYKICSNCFEELTNETKMIELQQINYDLEKQNIELNEKITKLNNKITEIISQLFYEIQMERGTPRKKDRQRFTLEEYINYKRNN